MTENNYDVDQMPIPVLTRWISLMEAINLIADECDERGIDFETLNIEPLYIKKYVERMNDSVQIRIEKDICKENNKKLVIERNRSIKRG